MLDGSRRCRLSVRATTHWLLQPLCVQYLHAEVLKGLQPDSMIISFTLSGAQKVTFNCKSLGSPDKLKICQPENQIDPFITHRRNVLGYFTALHMSPFNFKDLSSQCFTQWLTGSYLGQHTGLFSREVEKNYRPKHKYCGAQTAVPPVLTAALGLIETHPGEQQRRKTAHTLLFAAEESLLKNT